MLISQTGRGVMFGKSSPMSHSLGLRRRRGILIGIVAAAMLLSPHAAHAQEMSRVIVGGRSDVVRTQRVVRAVTAAPDTVISIPQIGAVVVETSRPQQLIREMQGKAGVSYVRMDSKVWAGGLPANDPMLSSELARNIIGLAGAWNAGFLGQGVTIAIVDTGVDLDHPDLVARLLPGKDFVDGDDDPQDDNGHGTHVAGIAAATANNAFGSAGVAPLARLLPVRVMDADGVGWASDVAAGIIWATDQGASVVNLSLATREDDIVMGKAVEYATSHGANVVCAAGNNGLATLSYPARYPACFSVGAVDTVDLTHVDWSNHGPDLVAGGVDILSTYPATAGHPDLFEAMSGTSMAAPQVAGAAAILRSAGVLPTDVKLWIKQSATDLGIPGVDAEFGSGLLNVEGALAGKSVASPMPEFRVRAVSVASGRNLGCGSVVSPCHLNRTTGIRIKGRIGMQWLPQNPRLRVTIQGSKGGLRFARKLYTNTVKVRPNGSFDVRLRGGWRTSGRIHIAIETKLQASTRKLAVRKYVWKVNYVRHGVSQRHPALQPKPFQMAILGCVNQARHQLGRAPLSLDAHLSASAQWFATDMANHDYMSHVDRLGRVLRERTTAFGYPIDTWVAETIAAGNASPGETVEQWRSSEPHWKLLMSPRYAVAGVGNAYNGASTFNHYWVVNLGSRPSSVIARPSSTCQWG